VRHLLAITCIFVLLCSGAAAKNSGKGKGKAHAEGKAPGGVSVVSIFQPGDRETILGYYGNPAGGLPPGLAKRGGDLPPGLEKQLRRNGHLPPGLEKKLTTFPTALIERLPPLAPNLERVFIGGSAVIWNSKTRLILDVLILAGR